MNLFTHYSQLYVNRRCRRAYQANGYCTKYYRYYSLSWERFNKSNTWFAEQVNQLFGTPSLDWDSKTCQIILTPTVSDAK